MRTTPLSMPFSHPQPRAPSSSATEEPRRRSRPLITLCTSVDSFARTWPTQPNTLKPISCVIIVFCLENSFAIRFRSRKSWVNWRISTFLKKKIGNKQAYNHQRKKPITSLFFTQNWRHMERLTERRVLAPPPCNMTADHASLTV